MNHLVTTLDADTPMPAAKVGGKVAALYKLRDAGFPVPPGVCLTTEAFHQSISPYQSVIHELLKSYDGERFDLESAEVISAQILEVLGDLSLPAAVESVLVASLTALEMNEVPVAVRSSAVHEDGTGSSFAGQYATLLGVRGSASIVNAVLDCWRSYFSAQAIAARALHEYAQHEDGMAVLIQPLIDAECAGVCFSIDPVAPKRERIVINSAWGMGVGVVEGSVPSDTDWLYRDNFIVEKRHIVEKKTQVKLDAFGGEHVMTVPHEASRAACLPESWLQRIGQFAIALENLFGRPQDVEWAIAGDQVWILQSRPITALPSELANSPSFPIEWQDGDQFFTWKLSYYRGYQYNQPLPLEQSQFEAVESIREEACLFMGVERNIITKRFNGCLYERPIPMEWHDADRRIRHQAWEDWLDRLFDEGRSLWQVWGPEVEKATERIRDFDLSTADGEALADHLEEAMAAQRRHAFIHPLCVWRPRKMYFDAYTAVSGESGPEAELAATQLLEGVDNPLTELVDSLYKLATTARRYDDLETLLRDPRDDVFEYLSSLTQNTAVALFQQQFVEIMEEYGERHGYGYGSWTTVHTPTWREQPSELLMLSALYLDPNVESPYLSRERSQRDRDQRVEVLVEACADEQAVVEFKRLLANGRHWWTVLETHNHFIDQMTGGQLHHAVMSAADWLVERQILPQKEDVFWLIFEEILESLRAADPRDLMSSIDQRKDQHAVWAEMIPPPILGLPEASLSERPSFTDDVTQEAEHGDPQRISGQAAAPGQVTGEARVVQDGDNLPELKLGDILIAHNVGPRWTPLFPFLGGLVLDSGSVGQHAAVTAREYGIAAVIGTGDATKRIPDKSKILVDGSKGTVQILQE